MSDKSAPAWPCPICNKGVYTLIPTTLVRKETIPSKRRKGPNSPAEEIEYTFTTWIQCSHCGQEAVVSGVGGVEDDFDFDNKRMVWTRYYLPRFCSPMPDIFDIPKRCPETIKNELRAGFALFWLDEGAAANRLRTSLERLMDHLGVKKRIINAKRKYQPIKLHDRIDIFSKKEPSLGEQLMSLKWLGNTGSHEGKVQKNDLLAAYEIMEHVLNETIDKHSAKIKKLAKELTKKHGK